MNARAKPIFCGTDFSLHASEAADVAAAIAARLKRALTLVNVLENGGLASSSPVTRRAVLSRAQERLFAEAERLRVKNGITVRELLLTGPPHERIVAEASRAYASLIAVSSLGASTVRNLVIGSVAERIAESSPIPTLIVRNGPALERWARGEAVLKTLIGFDFSASSDCALALLPLLRKIGRCDITVQYIAWPPKETIRFGVHSGARPDRIPQEVQRFIERDLSERVARFGEDLKTRVASCWGRTDLKLIDEACAGNFDLLIIGTHQRHGISRAWLGSTSRGVLHHAPMSVAVVPKTLPEGDPPALPLLRRILVTTDLSVSGNAAIPYAFSLVPSGGVVRIVHVLRADTATRLAGARAPNRLLNEAKRKLKSLVPSETEIRGVSTEITVLRSNQIAGAIRTEAERFGADALCIASSSGGAKRLFGSIARSLLKRTRRPVLVIQPPEP